MTWAKKVKFLVILAVFAASAYLVSADGASGKDTQLLDEVKAVLVEKDMAYVEELSSGNTLVMAQMKFIRYDGQPHTHVHGDGLHEEEEEHEDEGQGEYVILILPATADSEGKYQQPIVTLGGRPYFYKILYTVKLEDKQLAITKTMAVDGEIKRQTAPVEPEILQDIARAFSGKATEQGVQLP